VRRLFLILLIPVALAAAWWLRLPAESQFVAATPTSTPTLSNDTALLPDSARAVLANFYTAYEERDRERLATLFTPDIVAADQHVHEGLFPIQAHEGSPLFASVTTDQSPSRYVVLDTVASGDGWLLTIREYRHTGGGREVGTVTTQMLLMPSQPSPWALASYSHVARAGKYDGFLLE